MTILARDLQRSFGTVEAVKHIDLDLQSGSITALIGPNGAGKTTLLLMLAGLLAPGKGSIEINGVDMATNPRQARAQLGWMPDAFGTWDSLTAQEILTTFARAYGAPNRSAELLELVHLSEFANQRAQVLSRGQKQRLGLARALVNDPAVLLLDEPAAGMDPRSRIELSQILRDLADKGSTVLISSHVLSELEDLTEQAVFISQGCNIDSPLAHGQIIPWHLDVLNPPLWTAFAAEQNNLVWQWLDPAHPRRLVLQNLGTEVEAGAVLAAACQAGVGVVGFYPAHRKLEQAYLALNEERL